MLGILLEIMMPGGDYFRFCWFNLEMIGIMTVRLMLLFELSWE